jgi:hypothetical protein
MTLPYLPWIDNPDHPDNPYPDTFLPERLWLVESFNEGPDGWQWMVDESQTDSDASEFFDEVDALAYAARLAALDNHDSTHIRVRHRHEMNPVVVLNVAIVRGVVRLFEPLAVISGVIRPEDR